MVTTKGAKIIEGKNTVNTLKLTPTGTPPTAEQGLMYFDTGTNKVKVSEDGSTFADVPSGTVMTRLAVATLGVANATISATIPSGYRYLRVVLHGITTAAIATTVKLTYNTLTANYYTRLVRATVATFSSTTATDSLLLISDNTGCTLITGVIDITSPSGQGKRFIGRVNVSDGSTTDYLAMVNGIQTGTNEITSVEITVAGTTFTTATTLTVYGSK